MRFLLVNSRYMSYNIIMDYSVLMSVYAKEKAEYFRRSLESIWAQTLPPQEVVLVCDGPLTEELEAVIGEYKVKFGETFKVIRLATNQGLGNALAEGIKHCSNELVARMDSDDIALPERCELQVKEFARNDNLAILSGTVLEFEGEAGEQSERALTSGEAESNTITITGRRELPQTHDEILKFSRKRNPFNHPAVMYKKSAVEKCGYSEKYPLFEDYYLWVRMLMAGYEGANLKEPLLYMRTTKDIYKRRGGKAYANNMLAFHKWMRAENWSSIKDYMTGAIPHYLICIAPAKIRKLVYKKLH